MPTWLNAMLSKAQAIWNWPLKKVFKPNVLSNQTMPRLLWADINGAELRGIFIKPVKSKNCCRIHECLQTVGNLGTRHPYYRKQS